ncbi:hypothetical protein Dimus_036588 [Dionaea muscipula]
MENEACYEPNSSLPDRKFKKEGLPWESPTTAKYDLKEGRAKLCEQHSSRQSAKELLRHRFIRNARKIPRLLERIRERPKYQVKDDIENPRNGLQAYGEASGTVKVTKDSRSDETVRFRDSLEAVRTVVKPPLIRERREENLHNESSPRRSSDNENQLLFAASNGLYESSEVSLGRYRRDLSDEKESSFPECDEGLGSGSNALLCYVLPESCSHLLFSSDRSTRSAYASCEDTSTTGTIVFRGQHDDSGSPQTPRSRLGFLEKTSNSWLEDSSANIEEVGNAFYLVLLQCLEIGESS